MRCDAGLRVPPSPSPASAPAPASSKHPKQTSDTAPSGAPAGSVTVAGGRGSPSKGPLSSPLRLPTSKAPSSAPASPRPPVDTSSDWTSTTCSVEGSSSIPCYVAAANSLAASCGSSTSPAAGLLGFNGFYYVVAADSSCDVGPQASASAYYWSKTVDECICNCINYDGTCGAVTFEPQYTQTTPPGANCFLFDGDASRLIRCPSSKGAV